MRGHGGKKVTLDRNFFDVTYGAHELLHTWGLPESAGACKPSCPTKDGETYENSYDIMSAGKVHRWGSEFGRAGPNLSPYFQYEHLSILPSHKYYKAENNSAGQRKTKTIKLTSVSRPESPNYIVGDFTTPEGHRYTVEFRTKEGWDRAIPHEGIIINGISSSKSTSFARWNFDTSDVLVLSTPGDTWENPDYHNFEVELKSIETSRGIATVKVSY